MEFFRQSWSVGWSLLLFCSCFRWLVLRTRLTRISNDLTIKSIIRLGCCCYWRCVWKIVQFLKAVFGFLWPWKKKTFVFSVSDNEPFKCIAMFVISFSFCSIKLHSILWNEFFFLSNMSLSERKFRRCLLIDVDMRIGTINKSQCMSMGDFHWDNLTAGWESFQLQVFIFMSVRSARF